MNWKCIIGATFLTPVVIILIGLFFWFFTEFLPIIGYVIGGIGIIMMVAFIWFALYDHCCDYWTKKKEK